MSRGLTLLSFGLGAWALVSVVRAMRLADEISAGGAAVVSLWVEGVVWVLPVLVAGLVAVAMVSLPSSQVDKYLARNVRMGVMVAIFAVLLAWMLVLYAGYLVTLAAP